MDESFIHDMSDKLTGVPKAIARLRTERERTAGLYASHLSVRRTYVRLVEPEVLCITRDIQDTKARPGTSEDGGKENQ